TARTTAPISTSGSRPGSPWSRVIGTCSPPTSSFKSASRPADAWSRVMGPPGGPMNAIKSTTGDLTVTAYRGDAKTLLAFNFGMPASAHNLAGFTIQVRPKNKSPYFLYNSLQFKTPANHAQVATEPAYSSVNAPFHKFRWVHVPGSFHQGLQALMGEYTYTVTPRYFDSQASMLPLDPALSASVTILVDTMKKGNLEVAFTRGYMQSQAFVNHF